MSHLNGLQGKELCLKFENKQVVAQFVGENNSTSIKNDTIVIDKSLGTRGFYIQVPNETTFFLGFQTIERPLPLNLTLLDYNNEPIE